MSNMLPQIVDGVLPFLLDSVRCFYVYMFKNVIMYIGIKSSQTP